MLKQVLQKAALITNAHADGFISSVNDNAVIDVASLKNASIMINQVANYAILDLISKTVHIDTKVVARVAGATPNIVIAGGAGAKAGTLTETSTTSTFTLDTTVSTVADFEALLATSVLMKVLVAGTPTNTFITANDAFTTTPLSLSSPTFSISLEQTVDGTNWAALATKIQSAFTTANNDAVEVTLSVSDANNLPVKQVRATLTAMLGANQFSLNAMGLQSPDSSNF
jgi:hypothetical protein